MIAPEELRLLADEDVPQRAIDFFLTRGVDTVLSREAIGRGRTDHEVALLALRHNRIVATRNVRHFRRLSRMARFEQLSYLGIACSPELAHIRLAETFDVIVMMASRFARLDRPFNMEIGSETFSLRDRSG